MNCSIAFFLSLFFIPQLFASEPESRKIRLEPSKPIAIDYSQKAWNKNSTKIDRGSVLVRDALTNKIVLIQMTETSEDSSLFTGNFLFSLIENNEIAPELYLPPILNNNSAEALTKNSALIKNGSLARKPMFYRRDNKGLQMITIFDSKEQALEAYNFFRKSLAGVPIVSSSLLDQQAKAAELQEAARREAMLKAQMQEKLKQQATEAARAEQLKQEEKLLTEAELARRKAEAQRLAQEGSAFYDQEKWQQAVDKFKASTELDPSNSALYFKYGVSLYRLEQYQKSLAVLDLAKGANVNRVEKSFFEGLNYLKLNNFDAANKNFLEVKEANDPNLSASAAFFAGVVFFQEENFDKAKPLFEYTIDNSKDSALDAQAESYIDQIANAQAFIAERKKKWILTGNIGTTYDSNILQVATSDSSSANQTGLEAIRMLYGVGAEYRFVYSLKHEFSALLNYSNMYSMNKSLASEVSFSATDPNTISLTLPYKYKTQYNGKAVQLGLNTGYDIVNLDENRDSRQEMISTSVYMKPDITLIMSNDWFANYSLEYRKDDSRSTSSTLDADADANKTTIATAHTLFQDEKKTKAYVIDGGLVQNSSIGKDVRFTRLDFGLTYLMPVFDSYSWTNKGSLGIVDYAASTKGRKDNVLTVTSGLSRSINERWSMNGSFVFTNNFSNVSANEFSKWALNFGVNYRNGF